MGAPGNEPGRAYRHQVGFGAGVAETNQFARRKTLTDKLRQVCLVAIGPAQQDSVRQRNLDRASYCRMRVAIEAGGVLTEKVSIDVTVEIPQTASFAPDDRHRERRVEQNAAGISSGHRSAGFGE